jgi:RHS repeat-associated protein
VYADAEGGLPEWAVLGSYDNGSASGTGRSEYIWLPLEGGGAIPVGLYRNGNLYAIHADHLGTPRLMTDGTNQVVWQWPYSAFGNDRPTGVLEATTNPYHATTIDPEMLKATPPAVSLDLRFPGQMVDGETGTFYNYHRSYLAGQGRYTQADPIGLAGGLNGYAYVGGSPLMYSDPRGLQAQGASVLCGPAWWACAAAITGAMAMSTPQGQQAATNLVNKIVDVCTPNDPDPCKGLRDQVAAHERKLADFLNDPLGPMDNTNILNWAYLANNGAWASSMYEGRIRNLKNQIDNFKKQLEECERKNGKKP